MERVFIRSKVIKKTNERFFITSLKKIRMGRRVQSDLNFIRVIQSFDLIQSSDTPVFCRFVCHSVRYQNVLFKIELIMANPV